MVEALLLGALVFIAATVMRAKQAGPWSPESSGPGAAAPPAWQGEWSIGRAWWWFEAWTERGGRWRRLYQRGPIDLSDSEAEGEINSLLDGIEEGVYDWIGDWQWTDDERGGGHWAARQVYGEAA